MIIYFSTKYTSLIVFMINAAISQDISVIKLEGTNSVSLQESQATMYHRESEAEITWIIGRGRL